ncbi:hypothetical protein [Nocardiopsis potens]|uniref:hypothetical protein n=1 Tax=Nocardiopsis potens TaxID=1246458 RepID=UPI00034700E1|nr:hypothetical protein [Nocardiopsis potens]
MSTADEQGPGAAPARRHRPRLLHEEEVRLADGWTSAWRVRCTCGLQGPHRPGRPGKRAAEADREEHLQSVAPPQSERCRDLRSHRTTWWDACPVCAHQMALPGM